MPDPTSASSDPAGGSAASGHEAGDHPGPLVSAGWLAVHLGDPLIALESLYRYLRKFHALGDQRYVMATLTQVVPLLIVLLSLEFVPRRRHVTRASELRAS